MLVANKTIIIISKGWGVGKKSERTYANKRQFLPFLLSLELGFVPRRIMNVG